MTIARYIHLFAGTFILLSMALGVDASPVFVSHYWLFLMAFVGANLFQFGITDVCPMGWMLKMLGVPESKASCTS